jgi:hypothetical protein
MPNVYIGSDGVSVEQSDDGAFHVTEEKVEQAKSDLKDFKEIVNGNREKS